VVSALQSHQAALVELCRRFAVSRLDAFGSVTRADFDPMRSDVDLLVEFVPTAPQTLQHYLDFKSALEDVVGRPVDLVERAGVRSARLRRLIDAARVPVYAAAT
jgi:uncharacterized protein